MPDRYGCCYANDNWFGKLPARKDAKEHTCITVALWYQYASAIGPFITLNPPSTQLGLPTHCLVEHSNIHSYIHGTCLVQPLIIARL